ncbi:MAG: hypothetical protein HY701_04750 [Gemmatimonadetes bacterium]|nr:hypothetical protein [Gemmatimonadota bacterium]
MICKTAEYKVRAGELGPVTAAIAEFLDAIQRHEPATLYEAFQRPDGVSFVHFMVFPDQASEQRHRGAPYTQRFVEALYPRCGSPPVFTDVKTMRAQES